MDSRSEQVQKLFGEGEELLRSDNAAEALDRFQLARELAPSIPALHLYTGAALHDLGRYEEAIDCYRDVLALTPGMGEAHNNLGNSLMALGHYAEAVESFSEAAAILPLSPVPPTARATALQALGKVTEAEADCRSAVKRDPFFAEAHWNLALNLLLQGRYEEGWQEYEWRWRKPDFTSPRRHTEIPLWDGSPLHGRTILLHAEQGLGDAIQFVRYAPLVALRGGTVVIECHPELVSLFQNVDGVEVAVPFGAVLPPFTLQAPLLSLPRIFGTGLDTIPSRCPYVFAHITYRHKWAELLPGGSAGFRVGLVWAGKRYPDPLRSCLLADFVSLAGYGSTFFSLQMGNGAGQLSAMTGALDMIDLTRHVFDFSDTAALIEHLDLIISIDTSVAHLAGALGKPVFLMLPYAPDWRWLLDRTDSPWYPTVTLFRQQKSGEWYGVIDRIRFVLEKLRKKNPLRSFQRISD
jgi:tetratricopeptide (TPR) repeat protein